MKEAGKKFLYLIVALILAMLVLSYCWADTYELGERFTVRRGGKIEVTYLDLEGDPKDPVYFRAVGSSYFRLLPIDDQYPMQLSADPYTPPLGFHQDDYFAISDFIDMDGVWKVDGKGRIEVQFDDVAQERHLKIEYEKPIRSQVWVSIGAFIGSLCFVGLSEEFL